MLNKRDWILLVASCLLGLFGCKIDVGSQGSSTSGGTCTLASFTKAVSDGADLKVGYKDYGGNSVAQPFQITTAKDVTRVVLKLKKTGTFLFATHTLTATIEADANGSPSGVALGTSATLDPANVSGANAGAYSFKFSKPVTLGTDTTYWLRLKASYGVNDDNYVSWLAYDGKNSGYSYGNAVYETATSGLFSNSLIGSYRFAVFSVECD